MGVRNNSPRRRKSPIYIQLKFRWSITSWTRKGLFHSRRNFFIFGGRDEWQYGQRNWNGIITEAISGIYGFLRLHSLLLLFMFWHSHSNIWRVSSMAVEEKFHGQILRLSGKCISRISWLDRQWIQIWHPTQPAGFRLMVEYPLRYICIQLEPIKSPLSIITFSSKGSPSIAKLYTHWHSPSGNVRGWWQRSR